MNNIVRFPVIAGVEITVDENGRLDLNTLHRAAGGEQKKRPKYWLENQATQDLVEEQRRNSAFDPINVVKGGASPGTFAVEQLAVAYANWISPTFYLQVINTFIDYKAGRLAPVVPQSLAQALRLAADLSEEKEKAQLERDEAIRTKAMIGSKREATAMATASTERRRAEKLAALVGDSETWKQTKAIPWLSDVFDISRVMYQQLGKLLTKLSKEMGQEVREIEDSEYGNIKAYHIDVISEAKNRLSVDGDLLHKYRKQEKAA